ncbi:MAG: hypothetical protein JXJ20_14250 [Anaerolineae bacterium]|nr:hypothetical protein [Anaerolineae bacterium]
MDDSTNEERSRASLRGKGWEILLGQRRDIEEFDTPGDDTDAKQQPEGVDASALALTAEETEALLDFSPDSPAYDADATPFPVEEAPPVRVKEEPTLPDWLTGESDEFDKIPAWQAEAEKEIYETAGFPAEGETTPPRPERATDLFSQEAVPLAERAPDLGAGTDQAPHDPSSDLDAMIPSEPEVWSTVDIADAEEAFPEEERADDQVAAGELTVEDHEGGLVVPEDAILERAAGANITDPFAPVVTRKTSKSLFTRTSEPDQKILDALVSDARVQELWQQIDALHEVLVQTVQGDRGVTDVYQQELLQASALLLESRANYDDARAIVYRIRADLNRQRKVDADVKRYRPLLLNYYLGWGIAWVVLFALKGLFTGVADAVGVEIVSAIYHPMLFGVLGALISGYLTLERHTTRLRDFDPIYISWYLFNPILGAVMGLLMFLLYAVANHDVLQESATDLEVAIAWILCAVAGMNQNTVLGQMNDLLKRFGKGSKE